MSTKHIYNKVIGLALAVLTFAACSDTWNDHFDNKGEGMNDQTLWQAISQNGNLSNFAKVVQACGYDKSLNSSQVFTVFAPTNEAIAEFLEWKGVSSIQDLDKDYAREDS